MNPLSYMVYRAAVPVLMNSSGWALGGNVSSHLSCSFAAIVLDHRGIVKYSDGDRHIQ